MLWAAATTVSRRNNRVINTAGDGESLHPPIFLFPKGGAPYGQSSERGIGAEKADGRSDYGVM